MKDGKNRGISGVTLLIFILFVFGVLWFTNQFDQREREITWEDFTKQTQEGKVESYLIRQNKSGHSCRAGRTISNSPRRW